MRSFSRWPFVSFPVSLHAAHVLRAILIIAAALLAAGTVHAAAPAMQSPQAMMDAFTKAQSSVVGVRVTTAEDAKSADTLGQKRSGSGVLIGDGGLILTIGYLMLEAESIEIVTQDNKTLPARPVAYDLATGFGLLRPLMPLPASSGVNVVPLGSVGDLKGGEALMAVTGPQSDAEADVSMTQLISKRAFSGNWEYHIDTALFTSPPVQSGGGNHSGAPLFNQKGELVGVGSLLVSDATGQNRRMPGNMFVPIDLLRPILAEMQQQGTTAKSRRPWLGLTSNDQEGRVQVVRVTKDSPAQDAGLQAGDVVLAVDDAKVATLEDFYKKVWNHAAPDSEIKLMVLQGADVKTIVLKGQDRMQTLKKPSGI
jgi:serine protease Do